MHEWLMVEELVDKASTLAKEQGMTKVTKLKLNLGRKDHSTPESIMVAFQVKSKKTILEGAALEICRVPGDGLVLASMEGE